jgi:hypothetical protein
MRIKRGQFCSHNGWLCLVIGWRDGFCLGEAIVPMCGGPEGCSSIGGFIHPFLFTVKVSVVELCVNCLHPKKEKLCARARAFVCVLFSPRARSLLPSRSADVGGGEEGLPQLLLLPT